MLEALRQFFTIDRYPNRWSCGSWPAALGWLHVVSDLVIFASYVAIPAVLWVYARRRRERQVAFVTGLFCVFILSCGAVHLSDAIIFWYPIYPVAGLLKAVTALASVAALVCAVRLLPRAMALPGLAAMAERLASEVAERERSQEELRRRANELTSSRRRLVAAQLAGRIGDWTCDADGTRLEWSEQVFRLFGRDPALGPPATLHEQFELYAERGRASLEEALRRCRASGQPVELAAEARLPRGRVRWHHITAQCECDADGVATRLSGTVQDITRQRLAQIEVEHQRDELRRINEQLEQFAYVASHDLVAPLRKARLLAEIATSEAGERVPAGARDALMRLDGSLERMQRMVRDLLLYARSAKSIASPASVDLRAAALEAADLLSPDAREAGAVIGIGELPQVQGDAGLLQQVFQNLFANAIRYRDPARAPEIAVSGAEIGGCVEILVEDNGIGIPADQLERVFEPFVRLERSTAPDLGTGMGLAICRRVVESHGGRITAERRDPCGARFRLLFPPPRTEEERTPWRALPIRA